LERRGDIAKKRQSQNPNVQSSIENALQPGKSKKEKVPLFLSSELASFQRALRRIRPKYLNFI